jgi:hypothetical protein
VEAALACGVGGVALTRPRALQATAAFWMDQFSRTLELGVPVLPELPAGSPLWCRLMAGLLLASLHEGQPELGGRLMELLLRTSPEPAALPAYVEAVALLALPMSWFGERQRMAGLLERILEVGAGLSESDSLTRGWTAFARTYFLFFMEPSPWQAFQVAEQGMKDFREVGSERNALILQTLSGLALGFLGALPAAMERMREVLATARRTEQQVTLSYAQHYLALVLSVSSEPEHWREARSLLREYMGREDPQSFRWSSGLAMLARMDAAQGDLHEAETRARQACEQLAPFLSYLTLARAILSSILLAQGRAAEARQVAVLGVKDVERMEGAGAFAVAMHLALAEACFANDDVGAGEVALRKALGSVHARASDIPDAGARERFLRQVPENARTLELARQRWGAAAV